MRDNDVNSPEEEEPKGRRFILYRRPDAPLEAMQRRLHRNQQTSDKFLFGGLLLMVGWSIGMIGFEYRFGDNSTVIMAVLMLLYTGFAAFMAFRGNVGVRGHYHHIHAMNCVIELEDHERERFHYGHETQPLPGVAAENVPEYLRLIEVDSNGTEYLYAVAERLHELKDEDTHDGA